MFWVVSHCLELVGKLSRLLVQVFQEVPAVRLARAVHLHRIFPVVQCFLWVREVQVYRGHLGHLRHRPDREDHRDPIMGGKIMAQIHYQTNVYYVKRVFKNFLINRSLCLQKRRSKFVFRECAKLILSSPLNWTRKISPRNYMEFIGPPRTGGQT